MKNKFRKIIYIIIFGSIFINNSVNITEAFLDWDLWINLYKNLDEWLANFEDKQFVYELSGQNKKNISQNINSILQNKDLWNCLIDWINESMVSDIANWDIKTVTAHLKKECYDSKTNTYNSKKIAKIISEIWKLKIYYENQAEKKAETIHEISRIWMYADWTIQNSPFDIINDLQEINKILFTEDTKYNFEDYNFLSDAKNNPYITPFWTNLSSLSWNSNSNSNSNTNNNLNSWITEEEDINNIENKNSIFNPDWNVYMCPSNNNLSGLNDSSLDALLGSLSWNNWWFSFNYWTWWHIKLPKTNNINIPDLNSSNYLSQCLLSWKTPYLNVNDNDYWKCNEYFCITIDFIVRQQEALDYSDSHSIENILKTSNKHLKKSANTSLVQSKMTINNFEMTLRDLNLPDLLHIWYIITYKTPPILNLEELNGFQKNKTIEEKTIEENDMIKTILRNKYANFNLNYDDANNLNNFKNTNIQLKWIVEWLENPSKRIEELNNEFALLLKLENQINRYSEENISNEINNDILFDFNNEFTELEQYTKNIIEYTNNIDVLVKNLKEIPTYKG